MSGKYYVIEGLDGTGKSTLIEKLKTAHPEWIFVAEPGGTPIGQRLRTLVKEGLGNEVITPISELLMFSAARTQLLSQVIAPALVEGKTVVSDRNWISTLMYQGHGFGTFAINTVLELHRLILKDLPVPDEYLYLSLSMEQRALRLRHRGETPDRLESRNSDYYVKVHNGYESWAKAHSNVHKLDASKSADDVFMAATTFI